jgi:ribosome-associated protein
MDGTASRKHAIEIAGILNEHMAEDTVVLDIGKMSSLTDYFIICTVRSHTHMKGLMQHVQQYFRSNDIVKLNSNKSSSDTGWVLIDCGSFVVHLMAKEQRQFYELEKLWFNSERVPIQ